MYLAYVNRVKGMEIQNGFQVFTAVGQVIHFTPGGAAHRVRIQQDKFSAGQPRQGSLRANIDNPADLVAAADVPEPVGDIDNGFTHGEFSCSGPAGQNFPVYLARLIIEHAKYNA